ncbi:MAG: hypothetical protein RIE52_00845 [Balneola sp.]
MSLIAIKISKYELIPLKEGLSNLKLDSTIRYKKISEWQFLLEIDDMADLESLDEEIKDLLVYKGFNSNGNPKQFGLSCEKLIDKFHKFLE